MADAIIDVWTQHISPTPPGANPAGEVPNIEAAMFKLWLSQTAQDVAETFITLAGPEGILRRGTEHAPIDGRFENYYQYSVLETVGAGTSEVQRNIIARRALGLPVMS